MPALIVFFVEEAEYQVLSRFFAAWRGILDRRQDDVDSSHCDGLMATSFPHTIFFSPTKTGLLIEELCQYRTGREGAGESTLNMFFE